MSKMLVAKEEPVSRIFSRDYVFRIPGYQRPYAWTADQAGELIDDLYGFMSANPTAISDMPPYFLGSIVLIKPEGSPESDVVDGQQRLTTLTLLLSAIRANVSDARALHITTLLYEKGNDVLGTGDHFRLTLRARDREFFNKYVQHEGGFKSLIQITGELPDAQDNLRNNARLFSHKLGHLAAEDQFKLTLPHFLDGSALEIRCF